MDKKLDAAVEAALLKAVDEQAARIADRAEEALVRFEARNGTFLDASSRQLFRQKYYASLIELLTKKGTSR
jgi:hypothetical protein